MCKMVLKLKWLDRIKGIILFKRIHKNKLIFSKARIGMFMPTSHADQQKQTVQTPARGVKNE